MYPAGSQSSRQRHHSSLLSQADLSDPQLTQQQLLDAVGWMQRVYGGDRDGLVKNDGVPPSLQEDGIADMPTSHSAWYVAWHQRCIVARLQGMVIQFPGWGWPPCRTIAMKRGRASTYVFIACPAIYAGCQECAACLAAINQSDKDSFDSVLAGQCAGLAFNWSEPHSSKRTYTVPGNPHCTWGHGCSRPLRPCLRCMWASSCSSAGPESTSQHSSWRYGQLKGHSRW